MSSFSELRIALNEPCLSISLSHHPTSPILALLRPLSISFHDVYGCAIEGKVVAKKIQPTVMEWHPNQRILAIGWKNGTISLYQEDTSTFTQLLPISFYLYLIIDTLRDETEVHKSELILLKYNPVGTRMITCDSNGLVCVWRGITCLSKYQRSGLINLCCFAELNLEPT
jgi:intraflagellar transport protein 140